MGCKKKEDVIRWERRRADTVVDGGDRQIGCKEKEDIIQ